MYLGGSYLIDLRNKAHVLLGLEPPSKGKITFLGRNVYKETTEDDRSDFRKQNVGMVYQQPNWVKSLTVLENIAFPLLLLGIDKPQALKKARQKLEEVKMADWVDYLPTELSSGQQQKVALARALITNPELIIADEPTGNLDYESGQELMKLLTVLNRQDKTILMVTHDLDFLNFAETAIRILDGRVISQYGKKDKDKLLGEVRINRSGISKI